MKDGAKSLLHRLAEVEFFSVYGTLGDGNFRPYDWEKMAAALRGDTEVLWRFFLVGSRLPAARLKELVGEPAFEFLRKHNIFREVEGQLTLGFTSLVTFKGTTFFIERTIMPPAYFGEDTKALMSLTPPLEEGKCLCLYPGSGAAVLPIATGTRVETTFALGSYNEDIIRANLELNEASGEHSFLKALGPTVKGPYDVIFAAPPSAFEPAEIKMPKFIAGGKDGLKFVRQVLSKSEKLLAPGGKLLMTFMFFSESDSKVMRERLKSFLDETGLGYTAIVSGKHLMQPGVPIFNMMFGAVATGKEAAGEVIATQMLNHVKEMKFEAAYLIKGTFQSMAENVPRELVDYSELYYGAWSF